MTLEINSIEVSCVIGDLEFEREKEQTIFLDVTLEIDDLAADTDRIEDAVDYVVLTDSLRNVLKQAQCRLIEKASKLACEVCMTFEHVKSASVKVKKTGCVKGVVFTAATFTLP
ncbi:MAG: dihydroneopterin aldolase [Kiritimatiellae bacterium]|nr:dihydroneopterin aldolase [Kiritimatiellia bacterium]